MNPTWQKESPFCWKQQKIAENVLQIELISSFGASLKMFEFFIKVDTNSIKKEDSFAELREICSWCCRKVVSNEDVN